MAGHEPSRFVGDAQFARQSMCGNAVLAAKQMIGIEPDIQRDFGALVDRTHCHAERFAAGIAPVDAGTRGLAFESGNVAGSFAVGTNRSVPPQQALKIFTGRIGIGEARLRSDRHSHNPLYNQHKSFFILRHVYSCYIDTTLSPVRQFPLFSCPLGAATLLRAAAMWGQTGINNGKQFRH